MEENVINEVKRLYKKFGIHAVDVVEEIKKYDKLDWWFWEEVIDCLRNF